MKISLFRQQSSSVLVLMSLLASGEAFTSTSRAVQPPSSFLASGRSTFAMRHQPHHAPNRAFELQAASLTPDTDEEVARLRNMAAKLRAEASSLEAEQQQAVAEAMERAFKRFDTNGDGQVDLQELKDALEKTFKLELSDDRAERLMNKLDASGDGALQLNEFGSVDQLRNQLDAISREERALAREAKRQAQQEKDAAVLMEAQLELLNDREPSATDKLVSILPYLFPLLDGLQYARFLVLDNPENPVALATAALYGLYRAIPFGGFLAFFALSTLSGNPRINRLIRFNMQQAIYLDIALIIPGLLLGLSGLIGGGADSALSQTIQQFGADGTLFGLLAILGYAVVSSVLGKEPNKIPFISSRVDERMPTIDMLMDEQGNIKSRDDDKRD